MASGSTRRDGKGFGKDSKDGKDGKDGKDRRSPTRSRSRSPPMEHAPPMGYVSEECLLQVTTELRRVVESLVRPLVSAQTMQWQLQNQLNRQRAAESAEPSA